MRTIKLLALALLLGFLATLLVAAAAASTSVPLRVQYRADNTDPFDSQAAFSLRIHNDSETTIFFRQLRVRYWFSASTQARDLAVCEWASLDCANVAARITRIPPVDRADRVLELRFDNAAGSLAPGAYAEVQMRVHKVDWSFLDESDDYSFDPTKLQLADWDHITLYRGRALTWGIEPGDVPPTATATHTPGLPTPSSTPAPPTPTPGDDFCTATPWDPQAIYWGGDEVSHNDYQWRARWWTQGEEPGTSEVWEALFPCIMPTPSPTPTPPPPQPWPTKVFAPYIDVNHYPPFSLPDMVAITGQKHFTLAFVISDGTCTPAWGGTIPLDDNHYADQIAAVRNVGGNVVVSFGGAAGIELAQICADVDSLQAAYQSVIDVYDLDWVDFDIEGAAVADPPSIQLRNEAIAGLQADNPDLVVAYCLPVLPQGLTQDGLDLLSNAIANGVRIDMVNIMAMDYGDWAAPDPDGHMGEYAIQAAKSTRVQLRALGIDAPLGITPMIGQNDVPSERFYLSDAQLLRAWSSARDWVALLAMWSANRDNGNCPGQPWASPVCSGLVQELFAFTDIFKHFTE